MVQWLTFVFIFESKLFTFLFQGMFAIGWLELGEAEKAQLLLEKCFNNIQGPFQVPFGSHIHINTHLTFTGWKIDYLSSQVWSESSDGSGAVNFLTGMGGFLQAVLFGYTGFRLVLNPGNKHFGVFSPQCVHSDTKLHILVLYPRVQKDCLAFSSLLPNDVCELCVRGVNYLGSQMDWLLRKEEVCIILREQEGSPGNTKPCNLQVVLKASGTKIPLTPGKAQVQTCSLNMQFFRESFIHEDNLIVSMLIRDKHFSQYSKKKLSFNCLYGNTILIEVKNIWIS